MKKVFYVLALLLPIAALVGAIAFGVQQFTKAKAADAVVCTPTGYTKNNTNLTAAVIATSATANVSGKVNATGCDIGIYYGSGLKGTVKAEVYGAKYYGILVNGSNVTVTKSNVHNIGNVPFDGVQLGVGIEFVSDSTTTAKGSISGTTISNYQKGGVVIYGSSTNVNADNDTVTGFGPVNFIAQNGIEVGGGAKSSVTNNIVTGNSYTGSGGASSGGILIFGGSCYGTPLTTGTQIKGNKLKGNDVGVFLSNLILDKNNNCVIPTTPTNILTRNNVISNDAVNNTSGGNLAGNPGAYQAGVSAEGYGDTITYNQICGVGYTPVPNPPPYLAMVDVVEANPVISNNTSCSTHKDVSGDNHSEKYPRKHHDK